MQVSEVVSLMYKNGPAVFVPQQLLQVDDSGKKWLKLRSSNWAITKLILGHHPDFGKLKNPSLSASPQIKKVQDMVKAAVLDSLEAEPEEGETEMFDESKAEEEDEEEQEGEAGEISQKQQRKLQRSLVSAPSSVVVKFGDQSAEIKTPKSWKESDITVLLDAPSLTAVCDYIMLDVAACFDQKKRTYNKTGQYKRPKAG